MSMEIFLFAVFASVLISSAIAWTIKLARMVPAMQDMMPTLPGEQFFIVFARRRVEKE